MKNLILAGSAVLATMVPVQSSAGIIPRTVLMELGTATWCVYCPQAHLGLDQILDEDGKAGAIAIEYHQNDTFSNSKGTSRLGYYGVTGVPTIFFDGTSKIVGGGQGMYDVYRPRVESRRLYDPMLDIKLTGDWSSNSIRVQGTIEVTEQIWQSDPVIRIALTEDALRFGSKTYNNTFRAMSNDISLRGKRVGNVTTIDHTFNISQFNSNNMNVIVFVQENTWSEILAAKRLPAVTMDVVGERFEVSRGQTLEFDVDLDNITGSRENQKLWFVAHRNGQQVGPNPIYGPVNVTCNANSVTTETVSYRIPAGGPTGTFDIAAWVGPSTADAHEWDTFRVSID